MRAAIRVGIILLLSLCPAFTSVGHAAEYFVSRTGNDANDGLTAATALATIQKGLDLLKPGDTLTIEPGEYQQSAWRKGLGGDARTTIRARIPGTVLLRGDEPIGSWRKVDGFRSIYATTVKKPVHAVNEVDTLSVLRNVPAISELEAGPGHFHYEEQTQTLYIVSSDWKDPAGHVFTASVTNNDGLYLGEAKNVLITGLAFTGFHNTKLNTVVPPYRTKYVGNLAMWGIFLLDPQSCEISDCTSYLNGGGISVEYLDVPAKLGAGTVVQRCVVYGNFSQLSPYQSSGIGIFAANGDIIRNCLAYRNEALGLRFYQKAHAPGLIDQSIAWGNTIAYVPQDLHVKVGGVMPVRRSISAGGFKLHGAENCLLPTPPEDATDGSWVNKNNIVLQPEGGAAVQPDREFADPANWDYRLQSTSPFRGKDGVDAGPTPYEANIYFVDSNGDDKADGLSIATAWKSLTRASKALKPGDTLYLQPGTYVDELVIDAVGSAEKPISIRGRGVREVALSRHVKIQNAAHVNLERLTFMAGVTATAGSELRFEQCRFVQGKRALGLDHCKAVAIKHCTFVDWSDAAIDAPGSIGLTIQGNRFESFSKPAVRVDSASAVAYADYNAYASVNAWYLGNSPVIFSTLQPRLENYSIVIDHESETPAQKEFNRVRLATGGGLGKPIGTFRDVQRTLPLELAGKLTPHVVSATTVNVEWTTTLPSRCEVAWGPTPECTNVVTIDVNYLGNLSLTGLSPGTTYYFKIRRVTELTLEGQEIASNNLTPTDAPIAITTLKQDAAPRTYYVSMQGNDNASGDDATRAFRTLCKAASVVNVGDTVVVDSGRYTERVRMRATGSADKPITFRAAPGARVVMDGASKLLGSSFVIAGVHHLRFDGFYFEQMSMNPDGGLMVARAANFNIYHSSDVQISRCFSDGRGGYAAKLCIAVNSRDVTVRDSVSVDMMGCAVYLNRTPGFVMEHCVFATPKISSFVIDNTAEQSVTFRNNVFTDMLEKKSVGNTPGSEIEDLAALKIQNNSFFFRSFPPETRAMFAEVDHAHHRVKSVLTIADFEARHGSTQSTFADPQFAGIVEMLARGVKPMAFTPEMLTADPTMKLDFSSYFVTNPVLIERGIGLRRERFADMDLSATSGAKK